MKFYISTILLILLSLSASFGQIPKSKSQKSLMPDLIADGLKGEVKQVIEESEYLSSYLKKMKERFNTKISGDRQISSVIEYDEAGNRTKSDAYSKGRIFLKVIYDYLDNERISKEELITYGDEILAPTTLTSKEKNNTALDARYSYKLTYKYDENGSRIEENWIRNTGKIWIKDFIFFDKENRISEQIRRHSGEDKISSRVLFRYDEKGNIKQTIYINANGEESEKHESYEFDSQGNWIKHIVSQQTNFNPKGVFEPFLIKYRKITYFTK